MIMSPHCKVAVLTHALDPIDHVNYLMLKIVKNWQASGVEVVVLRGPERYEAADVLVLHVDLTVVPQEYLDFCARYPIVVNGRVRDISKRKISKNLLGPKDHYTGAVIVKANLNYGGVPELKMQRPGRLSRMWNKYLPWSITGILSPSAYPVFSSVAEVPKAVWRNRRLVVEKFCPEREGDHYCLRQWIFLGDRGVSQCIYSLNPIVKAANTDHREYGPPVPESLREMHSRLGFDYGKFDYVVVDGEVILLDVNRTPALGGPDGWTQNVADELAGGLPSFLRGLED